MQISITRGLAELKTLTSRIEKQIAGLKATYVGFATPQSVTVKETQKKFTESATAGIQAINDLINRRQRIKAAIIRSNAETVVTVNGEEMTVAEAIERKSSIALKITLLRRLKYDFGQTQSALEESKTEFQRRLDSFIASQEKVLKEPNLLKQASLSFSELHEPALVDPLNVEQLIATLEEETEGFLSEVDFVLSESNARTVIEV